ncbi:MAG: hypothetical protein GY951_17890, partial [Psychromonas sp.]|nr:hypothetical protein [Psychromonas sp.]
MSHSRLNCQNSIEDSIQHYHWHSKNRTMYYNPFIKTVPADAAQSNRHLYPMLRTGYKCLDISYHARYTYRIAISNRSIIGINDERVRFTYRVFRGYK